MAIGVFLSPAALGWLGSAMPEKTKVSPLGQFSAEGFSKSEKDELVAAGVIDKDSAVTAQFFPALDILAGADSYARLRLSGGPLVAEKVVYFKGKGGAAGGAAAGGGAHGVSLTNRAGGFVVECPADLESTLVGMAELLGTSALKNSMFSAELDYGSALALAALIDLYRRKGLTALASGQPFVAAPVAPGEVAQVIKDTADDPQWLVSVLKRMQTKADLDPAGLEKAFAALEKAGHVARREGGCELVGEAATFAGTFLVVETIAQFECGQLTAQGVVSAECLGLQAGVHDMLYVDGGGGKVTLEAVAPSNFIEYLGRLMATPAVLA